MSLGIASKSGVARASSANGGTFNARVYIAGGPPDSDGDLILAKVQDGHDVAVSFDAHDVMFARAEPAAAAKLYSIGTSVHAIGTYADSPLGRTLRSKLQKAGAEQQWSIAWHTPTAVTRAPTAAELKSWPDATRVIESWDPLEVSPVRRGSCGAMCRTVSAKCAGDCGCSSKVAPALEPRPADLIEWMPSLEQQRAATRAFSAGRQRWGVKGDPTVRFFRPNGRCSGQYLPDRNEVWVKLGLDTEETATVVLHELRHVLDFERGQGDITGDQLGEHEAEMQARYLAGVLLREGALE